MRAKLAIPAGQEEIDFIRPQPGPQMAFLASLADIVLYGGSAGGGKSFALMLEATRNIDNPKFGFTIFRRTSTQVRNEGSLWDQSADIFGPMGGVPKESTLTWYFPSGASGGFAHLEHDKTVHDWQGSQIALIAFDELTLFSEKQFVYMMSRNRSMSGVPPYMRATCNPDADSWVRKLVDWWIGPDGYPIPERSGVLRWFIRRDDAWIWASSREELLKQYGADETPTSFTFIPSRLQDNKILMAKDPGYLAKLRGLSRVERLRLLGEGDKGGNWNVRATAGSMFRREWFPIVDAIPAGHMAAVRFWDRACLIGETMVRTEHGLSPIQNIALGDMVWTRKGLRRVLWAGMSKRTDEIVSVVFSDGSVITGTKDHPVYTNNGWKGLGDLTAKDETIGWKRSSSMGVFTLATAIKNTITTTVGTAKIASRSVDLSTETSGSITMGPSPLVAIFTTRTKTGLITESRILSASPAKSTRSFIGTILLWRQISRIPSIEKKHRMLFGVESKNQKGIRARAAVAISLLEASKRNSAILNAVEAREVSSVPVFDITVEDDHEFFANGVLVHNSTKPNPENKDPDWTRGLRVLRYRDGSYLVADMRSLRDTPGKIEKLVRTTASHDGRTTRIMSQIDPGNAGKAEAEYFVRMLAGYDVRVSTISKDKVTRAKPASAQAEVGNIRVLRAPWNDEFFAELENFPDGSHDDIVDVLSGAFNHLADAQTIGAYL